MKHDRVDFNALDPTADPRRFDDTVRAITSGAASELVRRRAVASVVGQIVIWRRPLLMAATLTALVSGTALWHAHRSSQAAQTSGVVEALGVPAFMASWVRADETPTPAQLLVALEEDR